MAEVDYLKVPPKGAEKRLSPAVDCFKLGGNEQSASSQIYDNSPNQASNMLSGLLQAATPLDLATPEFGEGDDIFQ